LSEVNLLLDHLIKSLIKDKQDVSKSVFEKKTEILSLNIDLCDFSSLKESDNILIDTNVLKKTHDVVYLKSIVSKDQKIVTTATSIWQRSSR
tara:strand:- start:4600 stop:4875 length:276 start_codon:yes stop_codon:yes gene_type:complete